MPLTAYQSIVRSHLVGLFMLKPLVSDTVVFMVSEKEFVTDMALEFGYIPAFGSMTSSEYMTVNFIQEQPPC
jgi:hypothetical protein